MKLPQLSLRDLFWLVLIAGMGVGWWMHCKRLRAENEQLTNRCDVLLGRSRFISAFPILDGLDRFLKNEGYTVHWLPGGAVNISRPGATNEVYQISNGDYADDDE